MRDKKNQNLTIIDKEFKIEGSISSRGKLIIKGQVAGTIKGDIVIIAEGGSVESSATEVNRITIGGKFQGDLTVSKELIILASGRCRGKVEYKSLIVENGGVLNAEVIHNTTSELPAGKELKAIDFSSQLKNKNI